MNQTTPVDFISILKARFEINRHLHRNIDWTFVYDRINGNMAIMNTLIAMEETGGEPDVIVLDEYRNKLVFADCSKESPLGRRSICYDNNALVSRKENKPKNSAMELANKIGIDIMNEDQYRALQKLSDFDLKTSCWVETPDSIRKLGGALFCDRRYNHVFTYHNSADSYYAARGFRGILIV